MQLILKGVAALLLGAALVAVISALCGAECSLEAMKYYGAMVAVGGFAAASLGAAGISAWRKKVASTILHLGFALVLGGWVYNAWCGPEDGALRLRAGETGNVMEAGNITLRDFSIERWPDTLTVRQYKSQVVTEEGDATISVNHPFVRNGWWVYQNSYEELTNPHTGQPFYFTILLCVRDIGLPFAFVGGMLLILGSLILAFHRLPSSLFLISHFSFLIPNPKSQPLNLHLHLNLNLNPKSQIINSSYFLLFLLVCAMLVHRGISTGHAPLQNMYEFLMCSAALVPVLTFLSARWDGKDTLLLDAALQTLLLIPVCFFMDGSVKHLMPALQSPFFVPHVGAYVLGYLVLVRAALGAGERFVGVGFFLLSMGLVLGATWGKVCWGHWWQFDPKEMWSLATWFVYAAYFHVRPRLTPRSARIFLIIGAVMIVLTLTWINLSRLFTGMHSYA